MTRDQLVGFTDLRKRGWHWSTIRPWFLGKPAQEGEYGSYYRLVDVVIVEAEKEWQQENLEAIEEDAEHDRKWAVLRAKRTALYRLFDASGALLYVGITSDLIQRFRDHKKEKDWWPEVAEKRIEWFGDRSEAGAAEEFAVVTEYPSHNVQYAGWEWGVRYRERWLRDRGVRGLRKHLLTGGHVDWNPPVDPARRCATRKCARRMTCEWCGERQNEHDPGLLAVKEVVRAIRTAIGDCPSCGEAWPCAKVRKSVARYRAHPQYGALWVILAPVDQPRRRRWVVDERKTVRSASRGAPE